MAVKNRKAKQGTHASKDFSTKKKYIKSERSLFGCNKTIIISLGIISLVFLLNWFWNSTAEVQPTGTIPNQQSPLAKKKFKTEEEKFRNQRKGRHYHPPITLNNTSIHERKLDVVELSHNKTRSSVRIYQIDNFLTKQECDGLTAAHLKQVHRVNNIGPLLCFAGIHTFRRYIEEAKLKVKVQESDFVQGTSCINETFSEMLRNHFKWSFSTAFYVGESKFSFEYQDRLEGVSGLLKTYGGKFQVTSYPQNIGYKSHTDCTLGSSELRDRFATALVYLQDVKNGGETKFTKLDVSVTPKKGRLLIWNNMNNNGECDPTSIHEAVPVIKGRKFILQRWYYYQNFPTLGRRPTEPKVPLRREFQPRVSCDVYEEGSCRWYDEWGYDHINAYREMEDTLV